MQWKVESGLVSYPDALARMEESVRAIRDGVGEELVWLVEHPPLYTTGTSAQVGDVLSRQFPVYQSGRGGQVTYHGPGQRVAYLMLDLNRRGKDVRAYVQQLEAWIIATLAAFNVEGFTREGRIGVWVNAAAEKEYHARSGDRASHEPARRHKGLGSMPMCGAINEEKIAALGVRVQGWVTSHGIALNVHPDLSHYAGIVPCGIREFGVTSLAALGVEASMQNVDAALKQSFYAVFGEAPLSPRKHVGT